jgi:hypothetical protein
MTGKGNLTLTSRSEMSPVYPQKLIKDRKKGIILVIYIVLPPSHS